MATHRAYRSLGPVILVAAGLVIIIGVAIWAIVPGLTGGSRVAPTAAVSNIPFPEVTRVSLEDAHAAWVTGSAVFVDVRGDSFYNAGHIPGALSIPETNLSELQAQLVKDDWIITYCT